MEALDWGGGGGKVMTINGGKFIPLFVQPCEPQVKVITELSSIHECIGQGQGKIKKWGTFGEVVKLPDVQYFVFGENSFLLLLFYGDSGELETN